MTTDSVALVPPGRPPYLTDEHELPHPIAAEALWSENYLSGACFPEAGVGVWLHFCRRPDAPEIWEEVVAISLPGGAMLVARGATSIGDDRSGPVGPGLTYRCVRPFEEWHKRFRGTARLASTAELLGGPLPDGPSIPVDLDLTWSARGEAFDMDMSRQTWASVKSHYQQHCAVSGTLRYDDVRIELVGTGMRDHSWGPRDLARLGDHMWTYGQFPSGRQFMVFQHVGPDGSDLVHVNYDDGDGLREGRLDVAPPTPRDPERAMEPYELTFVGEGDASFTVEAEILGAMPMSIAGLAEFTFGLGGSGTHHRLFECPTRFRWKGETGQGISEWTQVIR